MSAPEKDAGRPEHTKEQWRGYRLCTEAGEPLTGEAAAGYVRDCIMRRPDSDFFAVVADLPDGPADIAHFGNGPRSEANMRRAIACVRACDGLSTEQLEGMKVAEIQAKGAALYAFLCHAQYHIPDEAMRQRAIDAMEEWDGLADALGGERFRPQRPEPKGETGEGER